MEETITRLTEDEMREKSIAFFESIGFGKYRAENLVEGVLQSAYDADIIQWTDEEENGS